MKLEDAIKVLEQAAGVVLPEELGNPLLYPSLNPTEEDFLSLLWVEDGLQYEIHCFASMNEEVEVQGSSLVFKDEDGEPVVITPLFPKELV